MRRSFWPQGSVLAAVVSLGAALGPAGTAAAQDACWAEERPARVWPGITFDQAADLDDYRRTMAQSRDQVRQMLEGEFVGILKVLAEAGGDPERMIEPVLSAVMALDEVHDRHREQAGQGVPAFLQASVRTAIDDLYRANRVPADQRRLRFANLALVERLDRLRAKLRAGSDVTQDDRGTLRQVAESVDLVAYGTYSSDGADQSATLTVENVRSGALCDYHARGPVEQVGYLLARQVFRDFQAVGYPEVRNPNPNLTWIRPADPEPVADPEQARYYCSTQGDGARLPYALELVTAARVGADGASYVAGGIPRLEPGPWVVADELREEGQYYFFQPAPGEVDNNPAGPVRTAAGLGEIRARYWCVEGDPAPRVKRIDRLYGVYREVSRAGPESPALGAVEYLLNRDRALGARGRYADAAPNEAAAWARVAGACRALEPEGAAGPLMATAADVARPRGCASGP